MIVEMTPTTQELSIGLAIGGSKFIPSYEHIRLRIMEHHLHDDCKRSRLHLKGCWPHWWIDEPEGQASPTLVYPAFGMDDCKVLFRFDDLLKLLSPRRYTGVIETDSGEPLAEFDIDMKPPYVSITEATVGESIDEIRKLPRPHDGHSGGHCNQPPYIGYGRYGALPDYPGHRGPNHPHRFRLDSQGVHPGDEDDDGSHD